MIWMPFLPALGCLAVHVPSTGVVQRDVEPVGHYVEARTASVFAGACHFAGERTTDGREALLAWSFEAGVFEGVDLTGASVAAVIVDDENLVDVATARRAVVYVPESASAEQRAALVEWLRGFTGPLLGDVRAVRTVALTLAIDDDSFALRAQGVLALVGHALPDRACCKMPYQVWYAPFVRLAEQRVGLDAQFTLSEPALDRAWSRPGENAAFFGRFGPLGPAR